MNRVTPARQRKRKVCPKCNEKLSHAAYIRHHNPMVCPPRSEGKRSIHNITNDGSTPGPSSFSQPHLLSQDSPSNVELPLMSENDSTSEVNDEITESELDTDDVEILSDGDVDNITSEVEEQSIGGDTCQENPTIDNIYDPTKDPPMQECSQATSQSQSSFSKPQLHMIASHISRFIFFFQLCYKISERGITLLLHFLRAILLWVSNLQRSTDLLTLRDMVPKNMYFLRKMCSSETNFTTYVVCPKCHALYNPEICIQRKHGGLLESAKCSFVQYPNHPQMSRREICNTILMKQVKCGSSYKLIPRKIYTYNSIKASLTKVFRKSSFIYSCEKWRNRKRSQGVYNDLYDGLVWENFQSVNGTPFLQAPNNFGLILNIDWFNPFKHVEYSVGVLYLVLANLPRSERYKIENVIIVGVLPGPKEPPKHMNSYLKPLVDELLDLWIGTNITVQDGSVLVRCALVCVSCDLPATRKVCGFTSFSSLQGCSKCMKKFTCDSFGSKSDYSGYERESWEIRTNDEHLQQVSKIRGACTATDQRQIEKKYGVRYSELLRLPYFNVVQYHVVDPMHNLLLGTGKYLMTMWKDSGILTKANFEYIQQEVDRMKVPASVGRIPYKISSNFSGFTADQWKIWICVYSTLCLKELLPTEHYQCWILFQDACCYILQPSLSTMQLSLADSKLYEFCKAYEMLYGKDKCTPNMHMHLHLSNSIQNYGPVTAFWCFPFERFNGILGTFQKNWISPEQQMVRKFIAYQDLLLMDVSNALPEELQDFFVDQITKCKEISLGEGSLVETHLDSSDLLDYKKNSYCSLSDICATEGSMHMLYRRYEGFFDSYEIESLTAVYKTLYPGVSFHVPMAHERFYGLKVFNEMMISEKSKGCNSSAVCANWAGVGGNLACNNQLLRVGLVQYFIRHTICLPVSDGADSVKVERKNLFARVSWFHTHPRENWFSNRTLVVSTEMNNSGPASFLPVSRIRYRCALSKKIVQFDYGEDSVNIAVFCGSSYCV